MGVYDEIKDSIRKIILMHHRIDSLAAGVAELGDRVFDHERRIVRIETMIEIAQSRRPGSPKRIR